MRGRPQGRLVQLIAAAGLAVMAANATAAATCNRTITADVVAIDMPILFNRLGASNVNGMMFALRGDVVDRTSNRSERQGATLRPGQVKLRDDKRPRPLVLRVADGDCLTVNFTNLLAPVANPLNAPEDRDGIGNDPNPVTADGFPQITTYVDAQVADRRASFQVAGVQLRRVGGGIENDGSFVGRNPSSLVDPGQSITYELFAEKEQVHAITSYGAIVGSDANQGNLANGLFGQLIIQPRGARIYRNTLTEEEMRLATRTGTRTNASCPRLGAAVPGAGRGERYCETLAGHPVINYEAVYPNREPWISEGLAGRTILNMVQNNRIVHTELDAVVAGPNADGTFPPSTYPIEAASNGARRNPSYPNRLEPYRDFAQVWHDQVGAAQAYPGFYNQAGFNPPAGQAPDPLTQVFAYLLKGVRDKFMINYGSGGIGTEILSNRLGVGPMHDCLNCAYEEFFLTHFTVGEYGVLTDIPANAGLETITPQNVLNILLFLKDGSPALTPAEQQFVAALGPKATMPLYPGDPGNLNHSYVGDFVKFRNTHNGFEQHVFHLHNHQWLFNPNDDNSNYVDAQGIGPGMGYTYEIALGGSGNRNKSAGDAIYHCHFYPHFAQGMWWMWRIHDTFEAGTKLQASGTGFHTQPFALKNGTPAAGARAVPDGELITGVPIPAVVPLPGKGLAPMPAPGVTVMAVDRNGDLPGGTSSQAVLPYATIAGPDGKFGTADDVNPGFPFWVAGIACGPGDTAFCEQGIVGQRPSTPPLDMVTRAEAQKLVDPVTGVEPYRNYSPQMKADFVKLAGDYEQMHGGLPRHALHGVAAGGKAGPTIAGVVSPVDLTKFVKSARPVYFPEGGTEAERTAMWFHSRGSIPSFRLLPNGNVQAASFTVNGNPAVPGAVYSDPCVDDTMRPVASNGSNQWFGVSGLATIPSGPFGAYNPRVYKGVNIQYDAVLNKAGYHYPQQRIVALWEDALPVIEKQKPGEPLVMRLNSFDCAMYHHSNLVPETYEMDDYQLRTPTDIIGQHIHLPKWDLTTTDGAANGWNYEDGTLAPGAVRERIIAIRDFNKCVGKEYGDPRDGSQTCPVALKHPFFPETGPGGNKWTGARITLQRWMADPIFNTQMVDRGLGIIFTHDHYGPSTFQQVGLYATVLVEPAGSVWKHSETGTQLGCTTANNDTLPMAKKEPTDTPCRNDGGPTSWQAAIETGDLDGDGRNDSYREFFFEYTDFQHAYEAGVYVGANPLGGYNGDFDEKAYLAFDPALQALFYPEPHPGPADGLFPGGPNTFRFAISPPLIKPKFPIFPDLTVEKAVTLGTGALAGGASVLVPECIQRPCPTSIDFLEPGMFVVNYRNEPGALRVFNPNKPGPDALPGKDCGPLQIDRTGCGAQADGLAGDLAYVFQSRTDRAIPELNRMPVAGEVAGMIPDGHGAQVKRDATIGRFPVDPTNLADTVYPPHINHGGFEPGDPYTPMLRTYSGDRIRIKAQAGGDEEEHSVSIHGMKWLKAGSGFGRAPNSGWVNQSSGGISEQFSFASPVFMDFGQRGGVADYLYLMDALQDGVWHGDWGIMRNYNTLRTDLHPLPNNTRPVQPLNRIAFQRDDRSVCPIGAPLKSFDITAVSANLALPVNGNVNFNLNGLDMLRAGTPTAQQGALGAVPNALANLHAGGPLIGQGTLVYNPRTTPVSGTAQGITVDESGPLHDPTAMLYVLTSDLDANGKLKAGVPVEPLALRVNAGDCVQVTLRNRLPDVAPDLPNYNQFRHSAKRDRGDTDGSTVFGVNLVRPSSHAGFHTQLLEYDVTKSDGMNVGLNPVQTVAPGEAPKTYTFYAGDLRLAELPQIGDPNRFNLDVILSTAVEFGPVNVLAADKVKQPQKALYGQLVVQPRGASFTNLPGTRLQADVTAPALSQQQTLFNTLPATTAQTYRDFTLVWAKMHNQRYASNNPVQNESEEGPGTPENPPHTMHSVANYKADPTFFRFGISPLSAAGNAVCAPPITAPMARNPAALTCFGAVVNAGSLFSNTLTGGDPSTPIFVARAGQPMRIGLTSPNSSNRGTTWQLHGHVWPRDPFLALKRNAAGFPSNANIDNVGAVVIGDNPLAFYLGAQESVMGSAHYVIRPLNGAGGADAVTGDYLFRDTASAGMGGGAWGILRVQ